MYPKLTHLCLNVANLEDCVLFYRRYCQMKVIDDHSDNGEGSIYLTHNQASPSLVLQIKSGGEFVSLDENDETHLGFDVESREIVDVLASMARAEGVILFEPDEYMPNAYMCGIKDPNGNCVEFGFGQHAPPE